MTLYRGIFMSESKDNYIQYLHLSFGIEYIVAELT
ncbi:hypothetical protein SAMN05443661_11117 [Natronobacterium gregoryi]|uniref:Uncharacterized protein n=2 Tax=Natronobacterium gregoryi TaxID=44930 RepID=L0AIF1_NATGS|nr:hypothetical protein Natgr_2488 [Natronobacterium gregoryi SP2]SFJ00321.1 hypothetical protein SAMN05443661_11117 [Natronobacterium gregoryi]